MPMILDFATKEDFSKLYNVISEIKSLIQEKPITRKWLKSVDVRAMLNISPGTLQNLRINGTLPYTKLGATIFYDLNDVEKILNQNKCQ